MFIAPDIENKIRSEAGDFADEMLEQLAAFVGRNPDIDDRILRCLVYLAQGKIDRLGYAIQTAESDWRDAIVQAEYEPRPGTKRFQGDYIQVRDFNKPFA
jgi:hypothetical protein